MDTRRRLGIYIHIPFCFSKCAYCDFYSLAHQDELMDRYQRALLSHIKEAAPQLRGYVADTVYFGGGTPSYYGAERLVALLNSLKKNSNVLVDGEITLEANPESVQYADLVRLRRAGFNRLSVGVQSANDGILRSIGRPHTFAQAEAAVKSARKAGFDNVSIDLIYGLPSQTREDWADTLVKAAALKPDHISGYGLTIEPGTPLYPYRDSPFIPDSDTQADMYLYMVEALERFGYRQYEISNFARRNMESRHNLKYWTGCDYMGFGAAAHSYVGGKRFSFVSSVEEYCRGVEEGGDVVDQWEQISDFEKAGEYLMLGLRTTAGVSEKEYHDIFSCSFEEAKKLFGEYVRHGWMRSSGERWAFTPQGFLLSNTLIGQVIDAQTKARSNLLYSGGRDEGQITLFGGAAKEEPLFRGI